MNLKWPHTDEPGRLLANIAALMVHRAGGRVTFEADEWNDLLAATDGRGALIVELEGDTLIATFSTPEAAVQPGREQVQ